MPSPFSHTRTVGAMCPPFLVLSRIAPDIGPHNITAGFVPLVGSWENRTKSSVHPPPLSSVDPPPFRKSLFLSGPNPAINHMVPLFLQASSSRHHLAPQYSYNWPSFAPGTLPAWKTSVGTHLRLQKVRDGDDRQDGDNRHHDQEFDKSEPLSSQTLHRISPFFQVQWKVFRMCFRFAFRPL